MHHCHATNCQTPVPPEMFMCRKHWYKVPKSIRAKIWKTYRDGQCDDMEPSKEYCETAKLAVTIVAKKEGLVPDVRLYEILSNREEDNDQRQLI